MSTANVAFPDPLAQIHELNRLYMRSLQSREAAELAHCGFPTGAIGPLRKADDGLIDALAAFPRALFDLTIRRPDGAVLPAAPEAGCSARQILELTIAFCAWNVSRDSAYHARLFFGLPTRAVHTLRTTPLSQLPQLALSCVRIDCAFADSEWLWRELLTETRPEVRRRLILVALQPSADGASILNRVAERGGRRDLSA